MENWKVGLLSPKGLVSQLRLAGGRKMHLFLLGGESSWDKDPVKRCDWTPNK
jgi:hypothetical protein